MPATTCLNEKLSKTDFLCTLLQSITAVLWSFLLVVVSISCGVVLILSLVNIAPSTAVRVPKALTSQQAASGQTTIMYPSTHAHALGQMVSGLLDAVCHSFKDWWLDYFIKFFINWSQINVKLLLMIRLQQLQQQQWPFQEAWLKCNKELRPIVS